MATDDHERAVELLKDLGMKTYEAECFVALHSIPSGTARDVSAVADVPRTRVYDATASLAKRGFVEVQHGSPQRYRATPLDEAIRMLREQYEERVEELHETLAALESDSSVHEPSPQEVWALSSGAALDERVVEFVEDATSEVVLLVGDERGWTEVLEGCVANAVARGVAVRLYTPTDLVEALGASDVGVDPVATDVDLVAPGAGRNRVGRLLLVDGERLLVSTFEDSEEEPGSEHAIVAEGESNGAVLLTQQFLDATVEGGA